MACWLIFTTEYTEPHRVFIFFIRRFRRWRRFFIIEHRDTEFITCSPQSTRNVFTNLKGCTSLLAGGFQASGVDDSHARNSLKDWTFPFTRFSLSGWWEEKGSPPFHGFENPRLFIVQPFRLCNLWWIIPSAWLIKTLWNSMYSAFQRILLIRWLWVSASPDAGI